MLFLYWVVRWINHVNFLFKFTLNLIVMLIFARCFTYLHCTEPFRKNSDGSHEYSLFLDNNRQHKHACAKTISAWTQKVLVRYCQGICLPIPSVWLWCLQPWQLVFHWCTSCRPVTWPASLAKPDIISPHTSLLQIRTRILFNELSWVWVSSYLVGKYQTFDVHKILQICWAVRL